ncbi:MAG: copper amine oxidase N-terminal domain-containing protein [Flavonifractor plautii]
MGTGTSALAAESVPASAPSTGISVQLDGRNLSFPDAAPEARDGRTFLPVRTVFEAMGAEVSYSPAAQTITAVRDGTTVTMALGGTTATVERSGVTTHIPMDAAPTPTTTAPMCPYASPLRPLVAPWAGTPATAP